MTGTPLHAGAAVPNVIEAVKDCEPAEWQLTVSKAG
jgi:hypothetical protein